MYIKKYFKEKKRNNVLLYEKKSLIVKLWLLF